MKTFKIKERTEKGMNFIIEHDLNACRQNAPHRHDGIEIMFARRGAGFCAVNGQTFPLVPGDFYLMGPEDIHAFLFRHDGDYYTIGFYRDMFSAEELRQLERFDCFTGISRSDFSFKTKYTFSPLACSQLFSILDNAIAELAEKDIMFQECTRNLLMQFLILAGRKSSKASGMVFSGDLAGEILNYIALNYGSSISLELLGEKFGYSAEYAGRAFKRKTGMNITEYLTFFRVEKACSLLTDTNKSISEIALECGFFDNSHFCRKFRKIIGIPPSDFRRKGKTEPVKKSSSF